MYVRESIGRRLAFILQPDDPKVLVTYQFPSHPLTLEISSMDLISLALAFRMSTDFWWTGTGISYIRVFVSFHARVPAKSCWFTRYRGTGEVGSRGG